MILSDRELTDRLDARSIVIDPLGDCAVQPASIDIRLGDSLLIWSGHDHGHGVVDPLVNQSSAWEPAILIDDDGSKVPYYWLWPQRLYLGVTLEWVEVPNDLLCHLHGRSSLARLGIVIHQTAGLVDPGWRGRLTLEITVSAPTILRPGHPIGQLTFDTLTSEAMVPYQGRYWSDGLPTPSRLHLDADGVL